MSHTLQLDDDGAGVVVEALRTYRETWQEGAIEVAHRRPPGLAATRRRRPGRIEAVLERLPERGVTL